LRKTPLRRSSKKQAAKLRKYGELKREFWRTHTQCEICRTPIFREPPHHTKGRGRWLLAVETWMAVCKACHRRIHDYGKWARELGYIQ
jgi:hypothetical protein